MITSPCLLQAPAVYSNDSLPQPKAQTFPSDSACKENMPQILNNFEPTASASTISGLSTRFVFNDPHPSFCQMQ